MVKIPEDWRWYGYSVNVGAAITFSVLFSVVSAHLLWSMTTTRGSRRKVFYTWPVTFAGLSEVTGFILRRYSAKHPFGGGVAMNLYIASTVFIVLAPAFASGGVYVTFGRLVARVGAQHSRLTRSVARVFVVLDVSSITLQAVGLSLYGSSSVDGRANAIKGLLIAGFVIQLASFATFCVICIDFNALLLVRSVYRCVEYSTTTFTTGTIREHEVFFYCLDALPVFLSLVVFARWHPVEYLEEQQGQGAERIAEQGPSDKDEAINRVV